MNLHIKANGAQWLVKRYGDLALKRLIELDELASILQHHQFPSVAPLINLEKKAYFESDEGTFGVFPVIAGKILHGDEFSHAALKNTAQLIAQFHRLGDKLSQDFGSSNRMMCKPSEFEAEEKILIEKLIANTLPPQVIDLVRYSLDAKKAFLSKRTSSFWDFKFLENAKDLIHGDFHNQNILYSESKVPICLLDFEECCIGHRVHDLINFVQLALGNNDYSSNCLGKGRFFLRAYSELADLNNQQIHVGLRYSFAMMATSLFFENKICESGDLNLSDILLRDLRKLATYDIDEKLLHESLSI